MTRRKKKEWVKIGNIVTRAKDGSTGEGYFFGFDEGIESITINGVDVDLDKPFLSVSKPMDKYDRLVEQGKMTEEEYEDKADQLSGSRVKLELTLPPQN